MLEFPVPDDASPWDALLSLKRKAAQYNDPVGPSSPGIAFDIRFTLAFLGRIITVTGGEAASAGEPGMGVIS